jgi:perosamine synthetase
VSGCGEDEQPLASGVTLPFEGESIAQAALLFFVQVIPYARQDITDADLATVAAALREPYLTQGPIVGRFEDKLREITGARHAVAFNSGTAALHAAYSAAGLGPGKKVVTSPISFVATTNAALYLNAGVAFADIDRATVLLDPRGLDAVDAPRGSVVTPVHFGGQLAHMESMADAAAARGWLVVEDAAHALGAEYVDASGKRHAVGACTFSAMCCLSFHPVKHITTGEGGAVTTNDDGLARALRAFRTHGITRDSTLLRCNDGPWYYEQQALGFNYRITDFQCALGVSQLGRLSGFVARRRMIAARYDAAFSDNDQVRVQPEPSWSRGSYHLYVIQVDATRRRSIYDQLHNKGIGTNVHYIPIYRQPYYRDNGWNGYSLPNAEAYYAGALSLPMFPALTDGEVNEVIDAVRDVVG